MVDYIDPTGTGLLESTGALSNYRRILDRQYTGGASVPNSGFASLEDFAQAQAQPQPSSVEWRAFPRSRIGVTEAQIDANRPLLQDEYVEWRVERFGDRITRITFCTEFPEYFKALAEVGVDAVIAAVKEQEPSANPEVFELFGTNNNSVLNTSGGRVTAFENNLFVNPWNNGEKSIMCLIQGANTLGALFRLVWECAIPRLNLPVGGVCGAVSCGTTRDSDPRVCAASQSTVRSGQAITLADPAGIEIFRLQGDWELNGASVDIANTPDIWSISRNGRRATLTIPDGLTVDGDKIETGAQVSRLVNVRVNVHTVLNVTLPVSSQLGNETSRV